MKDGEESMAIKAIVLLAEGFEEVEAITPIDYLRRSEIEVCAASIGAGLTVTGSHGITVTADTTLYELEKTNKTDPSNWDAVVIPGGLPGANNLAACEKTGSLIRNMAAAGKWVCAICASPALVLNPLGILAGKKFTCYPGLEEKVSGAFWSEERTVIEVNPKGGGLITSRGAGTAGEFAVEIISRLKSAAEGKNLADKVLLRG